jgi:hypothetical protein
LKILLGFPRKQRTREKIVTATSEAQGTQGSGRLSGKAAIVTSAARGIGRATAVAFAREAARFYY